MTINAERFLYGNTLPIGDETIGVREMLPQEEKERMA